MLWYSIVVFLLCPACLSSLLLFCLQNAKKKEHLGKRCSGYRMMRPWLALSYFRL